MIGDPLAQQANQSQQRILRQSVQIHTNLGTLSIGRNHTTEITPSGDVISNEDQHFVMINGQLITDPHQILGQCEELGCSHFLTIRTFRFCYCCAAVRCPTCAVFDYVAQVWLCKTCYEAVKRKRFWTTFWRILFWPFCKKGGT